MFKQIALTTAYITATVMMVAFLPVSPARGQTVEAFLYGNRLFELCTSGVGTDDDTCRSYIVGVLDGAEAVTAWKGGTTACPLLNATDLQMKEIVVRYLTAHVEERQYTAASLVLTAVHKTFNCGWR